MSAKDLYQLSLKLILKNKQGEILGLLGKVGGGYAGSYEMPGGRAEVHEFNKPLLDSLRREVKEEIGNVKYKLNLYPVALGRHLIKTSGGKGIHVFYVFFEAEYLGGNIIISEEHENFKWLKVTKLNVNKLFVSGILEGIKMYLSR